MVKQSLGKGLEILIPKEIDRSIMREDQQRIQKLLISEIVPKSDQPRRYWDQQALAELTESIKQHGVVQPIVVVRDKDGYRIVAGERRWRAAKAAGLDNIPAIVRSLKELEQIELALIENIQRVDLSPLEQALAVYKLQHQFNLSLDSIAKKLGKAQSTVSNLARLLQLPEAAHQALNQNRISEGHARAILALKQLPEKQSELLRCILDNGWTVRQAEQFVINAKRQSKDKKADIRSQSTEQDKKLLNQIGRQLATEVKITRRKNGGRLLIDFKDETHLRSIIDKLSTPRD